MKLVSRSLSALLVFLMCGWSWAAPVISNVSDNRASYPGSQVPKYEKFEITFDLNTTYSNPADPTQINVRCAFTAPSTTVLTQPGFYNLDYVRSGSASNETVDVVAGSGHWKIRFAPRETGTYNYTISATDGGGTGTSTGSVVVVAPLSGSKGFLKRNGNRLLFDDGSPYYGVGTDAPWFQPAFWGDGTYGADDDYGRQNTNGGNWDRLWIDVGYWASPSIIAERNFWNFYTPTGAATRDTTGGAAHSGIVSAKFVYTADQTHDNNIVLQKTQNWQVTSGQQYTLSVWIKTTGVANGTGGGAFITDSQAGQIPATPPSGTTGWTQYSKTFTASSTGRINPSVHFKNATGTVWFDDISLKKTGDNTELSEDGGFERGVYQQGIINLDESWKLDYVLNLARTKGVYVMLMIGHGGDTWTNYQNYNRYLVARYGYNTNVAAWEMCNENCFNITLTTDWSAYVLGIDPYNHLRTTSFWNQAIDYTIWGLTNIDIVQMHRYIKDNGGGNAWSFSGTGAFDSATKHHGARSVKFTANGGDSGNTSYTSTARPGTYTLKFWAQGTNVTNLNWTAPAGMVQFYDAAGAQLAIFPTNANSNSTDLNGTYAWKQLTYSCAAPANTVRLTVTARGAFMGAGGTLYFDELQLTDPDGFEVTPDYDFEITDYGDDFARVLFGEARFLGGSPWNKPIWWGELGMEDHNEPEGQFWKSPYHDSDTGGMIIHGTLWGSVPSGSQSTGQWWYQKTDYSHFTAVKNFMNAVGAVPSDMHTVSYLDPGPPVGASSTSIRVLGYKNATKAILYVYHKDYTWARKLRDGITPTGIAGASVTVTGLTNGGYSYQWWSPQTGLQVGSTGTGTAASGSITISLPGTLTNDYALYLYYTGATVPNAPSGLSATVASSSQINLAWTDNSSNETQFKIERKLGAGGTYAQINTVGANVTTYNDTGLAANTTYYYRVRANNAAGDSGYSNEANATTLNTAPAAPSGFSATAVSSSQINLAWTDNSSNESQFKIERKLGAGGTYAQINTVGANVTTYNDTGLAASSTYYYRVRANNNGGDSAYSNEANATTQTGPPAAPSGLSATAVSSSQINLAWTDNSSNETQFKIERKLGSGGTYAQINTVGANVTTYNDTGLAASTTYYYRVRANNAGGDSGYSNEANATTQAGGAAVGLAFNGTSSRASRADTASLDIAGTAITMEAWINLTGPDAWTYMEAVGRQVTSTDNGWTRWHGIGGYSNGQQWKFGLVIGPTFYVAQAGTTLPKNQWVHVAGSYDGSNIRFFINGTVAATTAVTGNVTVNNNTWYLGSNGSGEWFQGSIDEVRISNNARYTSNFTPPTAAFSSDGNTKALWHLQENTGTTSADSSGNSNTLTLTSTTWTTGKF